jgi:hypothetical protein
LHDHLDLAPFDTIRPAIESFVTKMSKFETSQAPTSVEETQTVVRHWGEFVERFGYRDAA